MYAFLYCHGSPHISNHILLTITNSMIYMLYKTYGKMARSMLTAGECVSIVQDVAEAER